MARHLLAVVLSLGLSSAAFASGPPGVDSVLRHYDAAAVADGKIQVSTSGNLAFVSGTSSEGPWMEVWRLRAGRWKMVAEAGLSEIAPLRFGVKRDRPCRRTS